MMRKGEATLKPCPFCGSTELLQTDKMANNPADAAKELVALGEAESAETALPEEWFVVCGMCGAMGPMSPSAGEAQTAWNKRSDGGAN